VRACVRALPSACYVVLECNIYMLLDACMHTRLCMYIYYRRNYTRGHVMVIQCKTRVYERVTNVLMCLHAYWRHYRRCDKKWPHAWMLSRCSLHCVHGWHNVRLVLPWEHTWTRQCGHILVGFVFGKFTISSVRHSTLEHG